MIQQDEFYYGRRQLIRYDKTGQPSYSYLPLALADFLNPQPGDDFAQGAEHKQAALRVYACLRQLHQHNPFLAVYRQLKLLAADPALQPAPDVMVIPNVVEPELSRSHFDVAIEDARPTCVIEVLSPRFAQLDRREKLAFYAQLGVSEYFLIDPGLRSDGNTGGYELTGYRLQRGGYVRNEPDEHGRLYSSVNRAWFALNALRDGFVVINEASGKPIEPEADVLERPSALAAQATFRANAIATQLELLQR
jgi:Uma2 family endonuclease